MSAPGAGPPEGHPPAHQRGPAHWQHRAGRARGAGPGGRSGPDRRALPHPHCCASLGTRTSCCSWPPAHAGRKTAVILPRCARPTGCCANRARAPARCWSPACCPCCKSGQHLLNPGQSEAIARCAALGLGIGCLSRVLVQPWLDRGELVILPSLLPPLRRDFSLQRPAHTLTAPLSAFVQACHAHGQLRQDQN